MTLFFVSNPDSPYYQSEAFDKLIAFIQRHPRECNLRDQNGKRSIVIKGVPTVEAACRWVPHEARLPASSMLPKKTTGFI